MSDPRAYGQLLERATGEACDKVNERLGWALDEARQSAMRVVREALTRAYTEGVRDGYAQAVMDAEGRNVA